jgi:phosphatidylethanolamine/phosphatidyl-N-methylethanolamine N-methyltransferase
MALFERENPDFGADVATRALSVTAVENDFVEGVYEKLAKVYDLTFGPTLHPGRLIALERMGIRPGDKILEVGVGTGINASLYPRNCHVTGIDFSAKMLDKARERVAKKGVTNVTLGEMDAANLTFADGSFDIVYAPYVISVVSDPLRVVREMHRVCRPGGKIVILNHFRSLRLRSLRPAVGQANRVVTLWERANTERFVDAKTPVAEAERLARERSKDFS